MKINYCHVHLSFNIIYTDYIFICMCLLCTYYIIATSKDTSRRYSARAVDNRLNYQETLSHYCSHSLILNRIQQDQDFHVSTYNTMDVNQGDFEL